MGDGVTNSLGRYTTVFSFLLIASILSVRGQDLPYVRGVVEKLAAPGMHGRGYVKQGDRKASRYLLKEYRSTGLTPFGETYYQEFPIRINTFPYKIKCSVNGRPLVPGIDFTVSSNAPGVTGAFPLIWATPSMTDSTLLALSGNNLVAGTSFLVVDDSLSRLKELESFPYKGLIVLQDKQLWWHVSKGGTVKPWVILDMRREVLAPGIPSISVKIKNEYRTGYMTRNVIGYIPGKSNPDTFLVFTAHYDHLGRMGKGTYFPGAHDNASGTAMMLDLARFFMRPQNRPDCSVAFIAFSGEEAGLLGSQFYAAHPLFPLESIRFLINLDLVGTGVDGIMVVNGDVFTNEFEQLTTLNQRENLVKEVKKRGPAANSDHYPFYQKGVPSFFIYTLGEYNEYHTVNDKPEMLPFTAYNEFFTLLTRFIEHLE